MTMTNTTEVETMTQRVIFRKWRDSGDVIAFFPDQVDGIYISSYEHVGQHGNATYPHSGTVPASPEEYADLLAELKTVGYNDLRIVERVMRRS
jgi:hypothetical protein